MNLDAIRLKCLQTEQKLRKERLANIAIALIVVVGSITAIVKLQDPGLRILYLVSLLWALAGQFIAQRGIKADTLPATTGLQHYRSELQRRRFLSGILLRWSIGPFVLASVGFILWVIIQAKADSVPATRVLPFSTLFVVWLIALLFIRSKTQRSLVQEIKELDQSNPSI